MLVRILLVILLIIRQRVADNIVGVVQDAKFKRREALADLAKAASKK